MVDGIDKEGKAENIGEEDEFLPGDLALRFDVVSSRER